MNLDNWRWEVERRRIRKSWVVVLTVIESWVWTCANLYPWRFPNWKWFCITTSQTTSSLFIVFMLISISKVLIFNQLVVGWFSSNDKSRYVGINEKSIFHESEIATFILFSHEINITYCNFKSQRIHGRPKPPNNNKKKVLIVFFFLRH